MTVPAPVTRQPPPARAPSTTRELGAAAVLILVGGGAALLASSRAWDTVTVQRAAPLGPFSVDVLGRTIAPAVAGLAVVALAGVIALLATRGRARVVMGAVLAVAGGLLAWQSATGFPTISDARARSLAASARTGVVLERGEAVDVSTAAIWPIVALLGALLVIAGGIVVVIRGATWASMSSRYDAPAATVELAAAAGTVEAASIRAPMSAPGPRSAADLDAERARADLALWQSLERGEDPTAQTER